MARQRASRMCVKPGEPTVAAHRVERQQRLWGDISPARHQSRHRRCVLPPFARTLSDTLISPHRNIISDQETTRMMSMRSFINEMKPSMKPG